MKGVALKALLSFALIGPGVAQPAMAQTSEPLADGWRAVSDDDHCDLRFYRGDMMIFMMRSLEDGAYSLSGKAFRMPETDEPVEGEIKAIVGANEVLLVGDAAAMQEQTRRTRQMPIALFLSTVEGEPAFIIETTAGRDDIPLEGFPEKAAEFEECSRLMLGQDGAMAPRLVSFDGTHQLRVIASRQRLLSEKIGFTLTVDADGEVTDCELSRDFRRRATEIALCRPFLQHATFEPARNSEGEAVAGAFFIEIDFDMWMKQDGYLEPEDR